MKRKKLITALAVTAALILPVSVFATTSDSATAKTVRNFLGIDTSKLTDTQKADITSYKQKMAELQKEFINKMVANGTITREQGDQQITKIDEMLKNSDSSYIPGFEAGKGGKRGSLKGGSNLYGIDYSKLTDAQKKDLTAAVNKIAELQKSFVNKAVDNSIITKTQGDSYIKLIDDALTQTASNGIPAKTMLLAGFNCFGMLTDIDTSKLTDAQKAILTDCKTQLTALQKELVNKMVSDGALTSAQGTEAINRIDKMSSIQSENGLKMRNGGMFKGHKGGFGSRTSDQDSTSGSSNSSGSGTAFTSTSGQSS